MTIGGVGSNRFQAAATNDTQTNRTSNKKSIGKRIRAFFSKINIPNKNAPGRVSTSTGDMRRAGRHRAYGLGAVKFLRLGKLESSLAKRQEENGSLYEKMLGQQSEFSDFDESELLKELKDLEKHGSSVDLKDPVSLGSDDLLCSLVTPAEELELLEELNQLMQGDPTQKKRL